jgi:hypothetical protein
MSLQSIERGLTRGIAPLRRYERRAHGDLYVHEHFFEMRYQQKPQELSPYCRGDEKRAVIRDERHAGADAAQTNRGLSV